MRAQRGNFHLPGDPRTPRRQSKQEKTGNPMAFMNWNLRHWEVVDLFNEAL